MIGWLRISVIAKATILNVRALYNFRYAWYNS